MMHSLEIDLILKLTRWIVALTLLSIVAGVASFYLAYKPPTLDEAFRLAVRYALLAWRTDTRMVWILGTLLACGALGLVSGVALLLPGSLFSGRKSKDRAGARRPVQAEGAPLQRPQLVEKLYQIDLRLESICAQDPVDIIKLVDEIMHGAVILGASDIHLTPKTSEFNLSYRVDGILESAHALHVKLHDRILTRIRVLSNLETYKHDVPQDGRLEYRGKDGSAEMRLSIMPTSRKEKVVMRVANVIGQARSLKELGFTPAIRDQVVDMVKRPQGLLFLTGPTGSGKTTTIYAALRYIHETRGEMTNIVTIEDPIEFDLKFLTQTQVNEHVDLTFARGLRSILRQDPNVIMVGEIRDSETSSIAIQAGLTGHLILTTVHTNSAAGVFNRLIETGVEPFLLASASLGVLSQRLVRTVCQDCFKTAPPTPEQREQLQQEGINVEGQRFPIPIGCDLCRDRGYIGRTAICELLPVTTAIRELINASVPTPQIYKEAISEGMSTLVQDGVAKAALGQTTLSEVLRVAAVLR